MSAILPLRFGSTAPDQKTLSARLKPLAQAIREGLVLVNDAVQLTLRVMGKPAPRRRIDRKAGPGTRYLAKLRAKYEVPEIEPLTEAVKPLVRAVRAERKDKPPLLASAYHLVPRQNVRAWRAAVARVRPELDVELTITGPWPPYAFAEL